MGTGLPRAALASLGGLREALDSSLVSLSPPPCARGAGGARKPAAERLWKAGVVKRASGLSRFYRGKSRSFACLSAAAAMGTARSLSKKQMETGMVHDLAPLHRDAIHTAAATGAGLAGEEGAHTPTTDNESDSDFRAFGGGVQRPLTASESMPLLCAADGPWPSLPSAERDSLSILPERACGGGSNLSLCTSDLSCLSEGLSNDSTARVPDVMDEWHTGTSHVAFSK